MAANCAGIIGAQLFRADDRPYYDRGWSIIAGLISFTLALVVAAIIMYYRSNARIRKTGRIRDEDILQDPVTLERGVSTITLVKPKIYNY
jgi:hypothetical protein